MTEYYERQLEKAQEYQDFVCLWLSRNKGINIGCFGSKKYQIEQGESISGFEIKHDKLFPSTGNLYIETHEKSNSANENYVESGILRKDNTWMWCIGNYDEAFLIAKNSLIRLYNSSKKLKLENNIKYTMTETSQGILIPVEYVKKYIMAEHLIFNKEDKKQ